MISHVNNYFKNILRKHKELFIALSVLFLVSLVTLTWFGGKYYLGHGDIFHSVALYNYLSEVNDSWSGTSNTGIPEFGTGALLPHMLVYGPLRLLGLSDLSSEKVWFVLSIFLPSFFVYLFLDSFFKNEVYFTYKIIASLFYVFNPLMILYPLALSTTKMPILCFMPLYAYILVKLFDEPVSYIKVRYALLLSISSVLLGASLINIAELISPLIVLTIVFLYKVFESEKDKRTINIILVFISALLGLVMNSWVLLSPVYNQFSYRTNLINALEEFYIIKTDLFDAIRLMGFWAFNIKNGELLNYPFSPYYYRSGGVFLSYLVPVISLIGMPLIHLFRGKKDKLIFFTGMALLGLFLVKGANPPIGSWYAGLFNANPILKVFREPYSKFSFITLFSYIVLFPLSLTILTKSYAKKIKNIDLYIAIFFIATISLTNYPQLSGEFVRNKVNLSSKQMRVIVPEYWREFYVYSKSSPFKGRILSVPPTWYKVKSFIWQSGFVGFPQQLFIKGNVIMLSGLAEFSDGDKLIKKAYESVMSYNSNPNDEDLVRFVNLTRILHTSDILQMNDFDWMAFGESYSMWSFDLMDKFYQALEPYYSYKKSFGRFTNDYLLKIPYITGGQDIVRLEGEPSTEDYVRAYKDKEALYILALKNDYVIEKVYSPTIVIKAPTIESFYVLMESGDMLDQRPMVIEKDIANEYSSDPIDIVSQQIRESLYKVELKDNKDLTVPIVFGETYSDEWKLFYKCNKFYCSKPIEAEHLKVNYYANGWIVDTSKIPDTFYISHVSHHRYITGIAISTATLLVLLIVMAKSKYLISFIRGLTDD